MAVPLIAVFDFGQGPCHRSHGNWRLP